MIFFSWWFYFMLTAQHYVSFSGCPECTKTCIHKDFYWLLFHYIREQPCIQPSSQLGTLTHSANKNWEPKLNILYEGRHSPEHRVGRVLSFFSSRRNWDSPNPSLAGEFAPPPPWFWGEGHTRWLREGLGESQFWRGDIHSGTLYIYVLCGPESSVKICQVAS